MNHLRITTSLAALVLLGANAQANLDALPSAYHFKEHQFPVVDDSGHCGRAANPSAKLGKVRFAQTHLMEPSWPFFYLAGGRPALIAVNLEGTGSSPDVRLTVKVKGVQVGSACMSGPAVIPPAAADTVPSLASLYTMTLPKEWVMPGMSVVVESGSDRKEFTADQLQVKSPTEVNLLVVDVEVMDHLDHWFGFKMPNDSFAKFAAALPASTVRIGKLPARIILDKLLYVGDLNEPIVACRRDVLDRTGCVNDSDLYEQDQAVAVHRMTAALARATGMYHMGGYTAGKQLNFFEGGAWGGDRAFTTFDYAGIMEHEWGHALGVPHWNEVYAKANPSSYEYSFPYGGQNNDGGGRGPSWNWEANTYEFIAPYCTDPKDTDPGVERKDAMASGPKTYCWEYRKDGSSPWIGFGEFTAIAIHENLVGNKTPHKGTVPYKGGNPAFQIPITPGMPTLKLDSAGNRKLVRAPDQPQDQANFEKEAFLMPTQFDVPVYTVFGTYSPKYKSANLIYKPAAYQGVLADLIDPTNPKDFADLKAGYKGRFRFPAAVNPRDMTMRFTYSDGTIRTSMYPYDYIPRGRDIAMSPWQFDILYFAINIPADKPLAKVEIFHRPLVVRDETDTSSGNLAFSGSTITAENFMDEATLVVERSFTDVNPPAGIVSKPTRPAEWESLGGQVTVRRLDGRALLDLALEPGASLERRVREVWKRPGVWIVQLKTKSESFSRTIVIQ